MYRLIFTLIVWGASLLTIKQDLGVWPPVAQAQSSTERPAPIPQTANPSPKPPRDQLWEQRSRQGFLTVGVDPSLGKAYLYVDPESQRYRGFEWDILEAIAQQLEVDLKPVYVPWSQQFEALRREDVDLILGAREALGLPADLMATQPYYLSPQRLVVPTNQADPPEHLSQLFGRKVGVVIDSTGAALLETYNRSRGNAIRLFATSDPHRLFAQLQAGQLDAVVLDQPVAVVALAETDYPLAMVGPPLTPMPLVGVVLKDQPSLKQAIDQALITLHQNGSLKRILEEWQLWDSATLPDLSGD